MSSQAGERLGGTSSADRVRVKFTIGFDGEDDDGELTTVWRRKGRASMQGTLSARCRVEASPPAAGGGDTEERRFVDGGGQRGGPGGNRLDVMEAKIKARKVNLKKMRVHLAATKRCMVDFTDPVEWHEQMIAEIPWPVQHRRALSDRQVAVNVEAQTLTRTRTRTRTPR